MPEKCDAQDGPCACGATHDYLRTIFCEECSIYHPRGQHRDSLGTLYTNKLAKSTNADQGMKKDAGKSSFFPLWGAQSALAEIAKVLHFGAKKYAPNKWREGMEWSRLADALTRHLASFMNGENTDPETNLSHLAHAGCCILFLLAYQLENLGTDDRWKLQNKKPD